MMNLGGILKMLGIKISPETTAQIEAVIPQIPTIVQQGIATVNGAVQNFDQRLKALEAASKTNTELLVKILEAQYERNSDIRPAGVGATQQRALESGNGAD
jgi:hypothetical protein